MLERAGACYDWEEEKLLQLEGNLQGKKQREWDLLESSTKQSYESAIKVLREKLNFDGKAVAAQDFVTCLSVLVKQCQTLLVDFCKA